MSAFDHRIDKDHYDCIWCCEAWPCETARIRLELAKEILKEAKSGPPELQQGMAAAAQLLLKGLTRD